MSYIPNFHPRLLEQAPNGGPLKGDILAYVNDGFVITNGHMLVNPNKPGLITHKLLPEAATQPKIEPHMIIAHTQASSGKASNAAGFNYALNGTNLEPSIFGPEMDSGAMLQCMPFNVRNDVSAAANYFKRADGKYAGAVAFETQDLGGATVDKTAWTWPQIGSLVGAWTAICFTYRIKCGDCTHEYGSGIAPHNRWPSWSKSAHSCPGKQRTGQMDGLRQAVATRLAAAYEHAGETCPA